MLVRFADGRSTFIDFRERAPEKASRNMYLDASGKATDESVVGYRAAGVPGTVRGFEYASKKYGRKPWADVVAPAVALAEKGFPVSYGLAKSLRGRGQAAEAVPGIEAHLSARRQVLRSGRNVRAAGTGAHAAAHPGARRARFLRRRDSALAGRRHGAATAG